jgi:hypothetical protein
MELLNSLATVVFPAEVLDLTNWYLMLPIGVPNSPIIVEQPELNRFVDANYFKTDASGKAVVLKANVDGVTASNTEYPRSILREMSGASLASWSIASGVHNMTADVAITNTPVVKPQMVIAQLHGPSDDVIEVRLTKGSANLLEVIHDTTHYGDLDADYVMGTRFTLKISAMNGVIRVYYNDVLKVTVNSSQTDCYFRIGAHTQSNLSKGDAASAYSEAYIYELNVVHA